ncbi:hypothetical protein chiPu_0023376, partial [Chiloscyllium punctatum]|nr:hypothetical protein [Chiloscyllium punctatum]
LVRSTEKLIPDVPNAYDHSCCKEPFKFLDPLRPGLPTDQRDRTLPCDLRPSYRSWPWVWGQLQTGVYRTDSGR